MHWTQIVLAKAFSIYFGSVAVVTARVKRQTGTNPVRLTEGQRAAALLTFVLTGVSYEWKIRSEEGCLREAHGEAYAEYYARMGRYPPRLSC